MGEFRQVAMWLEEVQVKLGTTISILNELDTVKLHPQQITHHRLGMFKDVLEFYEDMATKCIDLNWEMRSKWLTPLGLQVFYPLTDDYIVKFKHFGGVKAQDLTKLDFLVIHKKLLGFLQDMADMGIDYSVGESFYHRKALTKPRLSQHEMGKAVDITFVGYTGKEFYDKYIEYFTKNPQLKVYIYDNFLHIEPGSLGKPFMKNYRLNKPSRSCTEFYTQLKDMNLLFCKHYLSQSRNERDSQEN